MFTSNTISDTINDTISQVFRIPGGSRPIATLQLAGIPSEVVNSVASVLCRMIGQECIDELAAEVGLKDLVAAITARAMAFVDPTVRAFVNDLGKKSEFSNAAARSIGWRPRPIEDTIVDCAESLLANRS